MQQFNKQTTVLLGTNNPTLQNLLQKSLQLTQLTHSLHTLLDPNLALHCKVANLRDHTLILAVESAAWATQLRYQIPTLQKKLATTVEFKQVQKIEWFIQQPPTFTAPQQKRLLTLTTENAQLLQDTAESIAASSLKESLMRLAKNISS